MGAPRRRRVGGFRQPTRIPLRLTRRFTARGAHPIKLALGGRFSMPAFGLADPVPGGVATAEAKFAPILAFARGPGLYDNPADGLWEG